MFQKFLSYLVPINILKVKSDFSKTLEVTYNNGELVIDSLNTNYSYGSLQRILAKGLRFIGKEKIQKMNHILILGIAGGSVIKTLKNEFEYQNKITGVEIDPNIIDLANKYFQLDEIQNLEIIITDAFEFVLRSSTQYDLVIIDIFQDTVMPSFLFEKYFIEKIEDLTATNGYILFNTMILNDEHQKRNDQYVLKYDDAFKVVRLSKVENHNEVIIINRTD
ncbi:spermidine synthase [Flavobacterium ardleyense]|uniref:spermidine synthase n=1 Tax=Flavobacterium ardleyense TaxID=2038737 RepID=UPI00298C95B0|nr:fused MFS/spermidine synthase [Flavobacterium ardleyense]